jgi:hypothetical protein
VIIRTAQIDVFESAESPHFPEKMLTHVREAFPKHSGVLGDDGIREVIRYGIAQARKFGFTRQSPVSLFIDLTLLVGRYFHADAQMPWAIEILRDESDLDEMTRAQRLHAAAMYYLETVSGPANEFIDAAQSRLLNETAEIQSGSSSSFIKEVSTRLQRIWPEKDRQLDEDSRAILVREATAKARNYGIESETGILICIVMMYMLGSGFDNDPMFSWAHKILSSEQEGSTKIKQLHAASIVCLKQWCA